MTTRRTLLAAAASAALLSPAPLLAAEPTPVVASFSILGDMAKRIGGEHVEVTSLVGPNGDTHVYQPTPAAARAVKGAEVMIVNGLEFEGWLDRLVEAASFDGAMVVATTGIEPIAYEGGHDDHHDDHDEHGHEKHGDDHAEHKHDEDHAEHKHDEDHAEHKHDEDHAEHKHDEDHAEHKHGEEHAGHHDEHDHDDHAGHDHGAFDPHAWQSVAAAIIYVDNITAALAKADPANAAAFYEARADYVAELEALDAEIHAMIDALPAEARTVVTSHDAFQYFGKEYGLTFVAPQGLSTESEASAKDVAKLIEFIREEKISAVFVENIADSRLLKQIANETGAAIGGTLYPGALSEADGPAATYVDMLRHNATTLASALGS